MERKVGGCVDSQDQQLTEPHIPQPSVVVIRYRLAVRQAEEKEASMTVESQHALRAEEKKRESVSRIRQSSNA